MADINRVAIKTTHGHPFLSSGFVSKSQRLLSVNAGIDAADALETASSMLSATFDSIYDAGMSSQGEGLSGNNAWLVLHALETVHAIIEAVGEGLSEAQRQEVRQ